MRRVTTAIGRALFIVAALAVATVTYSHPVAVAGQCSHRRVGTSQTRTPADTADPDLDSWVPDSRASIIPAALRDRGAMDPAPGATRARPPAVHRVRVHYRKLAPPDDEPAAVF